MTAHPAPLTPVAMSVGSGDIGSAAPTVVLRTANTGSWAVACQARRNTDGRDGLSVDVGYHGDLHGDTMTPYLVRGGGPGIEIDRFVGASPDNRWLLVIRGQELLLVDDQRGEQFALPNADIRAARRHGGPETAVFDASSQRVVYFRPNGDGSHVVIRDIRSSTEREIEIPRGRPWVVLPDSSGPWARLLVVMDDGDKNGRLEFPTVRTNAPRDDACTGPAVSSSTWGTDGDPATTMWMRLDSGEVLFDEAVIRPVGDKLVTRGPDGAIRYDNEAIVDAACHADVVAVVVEPLRLFAACVGSASERPIEVFGKGLRFSTPHTSNVHELGAPPRLLADTIMCTPRDGCSNAKDGSIIDLHGASYQLRRGARLLVQSGEDYGSLDLLTGAHKALRNLSGFVRATAGTFVAIDANVIDLERGEVVGFAPYPPLSVDTAGRVLIAPSETEEVAVPMGPLRWIVPVPSRPARSAPTTPSAPRPALQAGTPVRR